MLKNLSKYSFVQLFVFYFRVFTVSVSELSMPVYFAALLLTIFQIAIGPYKMGLNIVVGITLSSIIISLIMLSDQLIQKDKKDGMLELIYLSGISHYWIVIAKLITFSAIAFATSFILLLIAIVMFGIELPLVISISIALILLLPMLSAVIFFVSLITLSFANKIAQYILAIPLIVPALILCINAIDNSVYLVMMFGLNLVYLPVFIVFSKLILGVSVANIR
ncbi:MAG: CcmB protein [Candidatus Midichloriaceae bacterium]|jgi:ABC-type transport system involved in cytochrome c biogenesis permease component|nr:CcmB protein [Candidatus Midichloriaceae bacterium]